MPNKKTSKAAPAKKAAAKKAPAKKPAAKKAAAKKAAAKKPAAKKAPAKKAAAKKAPAKKTAAKKAPAKKKAAAKKAPAKKAAAKKAPAEKLTKKAAAAQAPAEKPTKKAAVAQAPAEKPAKKPAAKKPAAVVAANAPTTSATTDYAAAIARIEAKAAAAGVTLAKGASAKEVAAAEKALGMSLPAEVVAFYRSHDGSEDDGAVDGRELLSLSRMVSEWKIWKDLLDQGVFEANDHGRPDPGVQRKWWIAEWVPVTYDGAGNHHVLDLAPTASGTRGQILSFWHDDDPRTIVSKSFLAWLEETTWGGQEGHDLRDDDDGDDDASDDDAADDDDTDDDDAGGGFQRFELDQKFWAIRLDDDSFTVRFGKLGTEGQEQVKSFADTAAARKEHDKLVAAKVKKGYREV